MSRRFYLPSPKNIRLSAVPNRAVLVTWLASFAAVIISGVALWVAVAKETRQPEQGTTATMQQDLPRTLIATAMSDSLVDSVHVSAPGSGVVANDTVVAAPTVPVERDRNLPIRLQVLNGCGVKGLARLISPGLRARGFDVREVRNAGHFRHVKSEILDRSGIPGLAETVADSLRIPREQIRHEDSGGLVDIDVTLVVGSDYDKMGVMTKPKN